MGTSPGPNARRGSLLSWVLASFLGVAIGVVGQWFLDMDAGLAENEVANRVYGLFMAGLLGFAVANLCFVISIGADKASMRQWLVRHRVWVLASALGGVLGTGAGWAAATAVGRAGIFDGSFGLGLEPSLVIAAEAGLKVALLGASGVAAVGIVVGIMQWVGPKEHPVSGVKWLIARVEGFTVALVVVAVAAGAAFGVASAAFVGVLEPLLVRLGDGSAFDRMLGNAILAGPGLVLVAAAGASVWVLGWLLLRLDIARVGRIVAGEDTGAVLAASTSAIAAAAGAAIGTALSVPLGSELGGYATGAVVLATESTILNGPVARKVDLWVLFSLQSLVIAMVTSAGWSIDGVGIGLGLPMFGAAYGVLVGLILVMCRKPS